MSKKRFTDQGMARRGIVLHLLRDDHHERWTRTELRDELYDIKKSAIDKALVALAEDGVVDLEGEYVWASRCALCLDELGMVSI
jgi:DNA-binding HxlR family transcriptional regulator